MPEVMARTRQLANGLPVLYTEYNSGLLSDIGFDYPNHDLPYAASFIVRNVRECQGLVDLMSYWTFSDIFEEGGFDPRPCVLSFTMPP
jgi:xylan 1,4-beta-xylosidase